MYDRGCSANVTRPPAGLHPPTLTTAASFSVLNNNPYDRSVDIFISSYCLHPTTAFGMCLVARARPPARLSPATQPDPASPPPPRPALTRRE